MVKKIRSELDEYFRGKRSLFSFPMTSEGTPFQHKVWDTMNEIPSGTTATYGEIARKIGHPKAVRAVGTACGANPILIAVPCHRVIAENGLGGYGGGLLKKKYLLKLERGAQNTIKTYDVRWKT